ncbi:hypothetical protein Ae201684_015890 [Aphanomyces euteiches]|uniref:Uncharacterized protein n=1 Tax=Aphanomyces euteiches TaxID=100861 RepID=A0A6G0WEJ0_9STRA|nr:hypothetical protein Ae201684_015890 [Aphanomyces euteiches]
MGTNASRLEYNKLRQLEAMMVDTSNTEGPSIRRLKTDSRCGFLTFSPAIQHLGQRASHEWNNTTAISTTDTLNYNTQTPFSL